MKTDIYILLVQNFFKISSTEFAVAVGHENISLFPTIEKALEASNKAAEMLNEKNFHVTNSGTDDDNPFVCYWSRYENDLNRAVVFTIMRKSVEGDLFQY